MKEPKISKIVTIDDTIRDGYRVIKYEGSGGLTKDSEDSKEFFEALQDEVAESPTKEPKLKYCLDLSRVEFVDSHTIGDLIGFHIQLQYAGGDCVSVISKEKLSLILNLTYLGMIFDLYGSVEDFKQDKKLSK